MIFYMPSHKKLYTRLIFARSRNSGILKSQMYKRERGGSVVEYLTRDRGAPGSSLTGVTALLSLSKTHLS